ncbi:MAG: hypothetical protein E7191_00755 [Erysipelotrichaceae bacterium]|nr:hypothetical protein [Erysipelotrichaceae bacterium]
MEQKRRKKQQQKIAYVIILATLLLAIYLSSQKQVLGINLIIGVLFGMIMSRTKFSFSGNLRGPVLFNDFSNTKLFWRMAVITCIGINSVIVICTLLGDFDYIKYLQEPTKVSVYFLFAAVIFGVGIGLIGCAGSGIIRNVANLKADYIVIMICYFLGSIAGVLVREVAVGYFGEYSLFMPELFGWPMAIMIQAMLLYLYRKAVNYAEKSECEEDITYEQERSEASFKKHLRLRNDS